MRASCLYLFVFAYMLTIMSMSKVDAATEPVCAYRNSEDETVFLKYLPLLKRGEDYVDFSADGKCVKRASCSDTFTTIVEDCNKYKVTCTNKKRFDGVFPACCVKC